MIKWNNPIESTFITRERRFFANMNINGISTQCYCPNTGKMAGLLVPGAKCLLSHKDSGIPYQWEAINLNDVWIGVDTSIPNKLGPYAIDYLIQTNQLESGLLEKEVKFGHFRVDYKIGHQLIEIKHVHWIVDNMALFPDCITSRGARQLEDMINLQLQGFKCYNLYILQRNDCDQLSIASLDSNYYNQSINAKNHGIKSFAFNCNINTIGIEINKQITFKL